jgi:toxin-antitoxin system PIN domain toxin
VKLPDVNLLLYAADETARLHGRALAWIEDTLSGSETVAFAWGPLRVFVRISTSPHGGSMRWSAEQALDVVDSWLAQPVATIVHPTHRHATVLRDLLTPLGAGGNLTSDAHLAALAIEHGATLCSRQRLLALLRPALGRSAAGGLSAHSVSAAGSSRSSRMRARKRAASAP